MGSKQWKATERTVAGYIGGKRYPANQGGRVDCESDQYVVQVKERRSLSLEQLTQLVEEMEAIGRERGKLGIVAVKVRRGSGHKSPMLIVQSAEQWRQQAKTISVTFQKKSPSGDDPLGPLKDGSDGLLG